MAVKRLKKLDKKLSDNLYSDKDMLVFTNVHLVNSHRETVASDDYCYSVEEFDCLFNVVSDLNRLIKSRDSSVLRKHSFITVVFFKFNKS